MEALSTKSQLDMARNVHDLGSINKMREAIASGDENVLREAAEQFEAIFVQMMLKSMRKAQDALADQDNPLNSQQVKFYRDMHDQQLATDLTSNGGMGLADIIVKQLGQTEDSYKPASVIRSDGNLLSLNSHRVKSVKNAQEFAISSQSLGIKSATKDAIFESPKQFVETLMPIAQKVAAQYGMDPKAIVSQAAVETGWGKFVIHTADGKSSYNLFGIKADKHWGGEQAVVDTLEFKNGVAQRQKAAFRAYPSLEESLQDYGRFITSSPRYSQAIEKASDAMSYSRELQAAGYATDPEYANKIMAVYHGERLNAILP